MNASLTRPGAIRTGEGPAPQVAAVAVIAHTAREAGAVASALQPRLSNLVLVPAGLSGYLAAVGAPARVILCATRGTARQGLGFLARASARLLWPAPPSDIDAAIGGLRDTESVRRRRAARPGRPRSALLLEGPVDSLRARTARAAVGETGPRDWIVESARHVAIPARGLAALERSGIRWSALEPVELLAAVCAGAALARTVRAQLWLPAGTPVWLTTRRR